MRNQPGLHLEQGQHALGFQRGTCGYTGFWQRVVVRLHQLLVCSTQRLQAVLGVLSLELGGLFVVADTAVKDGNRAQPAIVRSLRHGERRHGFVGLGLRQGGSDFFAYAPHQGLASVQHICRSVHHTLDRPLAVLGLQRVRRAFEDFGSLGGVRARVGLRQLPTHASQDVSEFGRALLHHLGPGGRVGFRKVDSLQACQLSTDAQDFAQGRILVGWQAQHVPNQRSEPVPCRSVLVRDGLHVLLHLTVGQRP